MLGVNIDQNFAPKQGLKKVSKIHKSGNTFLTLPICKLDASLAAGAASLDLHTHYP